ncbi:MAG: hypothetical protein KDC84_15750 [Crocinitomicaceae bacterium]|nr:hypothetical protein [Crocinitomicaceae bacterium]
MNSKEIILKSINKIIANRKYKGLNIYHMSFNPANCNMSEGQLMYIANSNILRNIFKAESERIKALIVIEYGKDVTDLNNPTIRHLGTHFHMVFVSSLSLSKLKSITQENVNVRYNCKITTLNTMENKYYWCKDFETFGDVKVWSNCL